MQLSWRTRCQGRLYQYFSVYYNTRHKSLKQEPFVLNFLQISYIQSSHLCSHSNVPLSFPNVELSIFWSTEMTANPNQLWGGENHTSVSRFVMRTVACKLMYRKSPKIQVIWYIHLIYNSFVHVDIHTYM